MSRPRHRASRSNARTAAPAASQAAVSSALSLAGRARCRTARPDGRRVAVTAAGGKGVVPEDMARVEGRGGGQAAAVVARPAEREANEKGDGVGKRAAGMLTRGRDENARPGDGGRAHTRGDGGPCHALQLVVPALPLAEVVRFSRAVARRRAMSRAGWGDRRRERRGDKKRERESAHGCGPCPCLHFSFFSRVSPRTPPQRENPSLPLSESSAKNPLCRPLACVAPASPLAPRSLLPLLFFPPDRFQSKKWGSPSPSCLRGCSPRRRCGS